MKKAAKEIFRTVEIINLDEGPVKIGLPKYLSESSFFEFKEWLGLLSSKYERRAGITERYFVTQNSDGLTHEQLIGAFDSILNLAVGTADLSDSERLKLIEREVLAVKGTRVVLPAGEQSSDGPF